MSKLLSSVENCRQFLIDLGTHNSDGTLTEVYGGEYTLNEMININDN